MATEDTLLGTSGKDPLPFNFQVEEQKIARQRAIAKLMMQQGLTPPEAPERFGLHVANPGITPHVSKALQLFLGQKDAAAADAGQLDLGRRAEAAKAADLSAVMGLQNGQPGQLGPQAGPPEESVAFPGTPGPGLPPIAQGGVPPDLKAAIARSMQSPWQSVQQYGAGLQKNENTERTEIAKLLGGDRGAQFMQGGSSRAAIPPMQPAPLEFAKSPDGSELASTLDPKTGERKFSWAPKASTTTNTLDARVGGKTDEALDHAAVTKLNESRAALRTSVPESLLSISRIAGLLAKGADVGGGASFRQALRMFAQNFGVTVPETGMTAALSTELFNNVLNRARVLAPVTKNDVDMLQKLLGSIDTDPNALREIQAVMLAKNLLSLQLHNQDVDVNAAVSSGTKSKYQALKLPIPKVDIQDAAMLGRAYQLMSQAGADMHEFEYDGRPASEAKFNFDLLTPQAPSRIKRRQ